MQLVPAPLDLRRLLRQLVDEVASVTSHRCPIVLDLDGLDGGRPATRACCATS
jgi:hypothetical protein